MGKPYGYTPLELRSAPRQNVTMFKKIVRWLVFFAAIGQLVALVFFGQSYMPEIPY